MMASRYDPLCGPYCRSSKWTSLRTCTSSRRAPYSTAPRPLQFTTTSSTRAPSESGILTEDAHKSFPTVAGSGSIFDVPPAARLSCMPLSFFLRVCSGGGEAVHTACCPTSLSVFFLLLYAIVCIPSPATLRATHARMTTRGHIYIHSFTHLLPHSLTNSLTHSPTHTHVRAHANAGHMHPLYYTTHLAGLPGTKPPVGSGAAWKTSSSADQ